MCQILCFPIRRTKVYHPSFYYYCLHDLVFDLSYNDVSSFFGFVATLCNLMVYNCHISPSQDKYSSPSGSNPFSCLEWESNSIKRWNISFSATDIRETFFFVMQAPCEQLLRTLNIYEQHHSHYPFKLQLSFFHLFVVVFCLAHGLSWKIQGVIT